MFDRQYRLYSQILLAADVFALFPALFLAYHSRFYLYLLAPLEMKRLLNPELLPLRDYLVYVLVFLPVWCLFLMGTQRYSDLLRLPLQKQVGRLLNFFLITGSLMGLVSFSFKLEVSRPIFFVFFALTILLLPLNRVLLDFLLRSRNLSEHNKIRILIVGTDEKARKVGKILEGSRKWGYHVEGYVSTGDPAAVPRHLKVIGTFQDLPGLLLDQTVVDEVIFSSVQKRNLKEFDDVVRLCAELGIKTRVTTDLVSLSTSKVSLEFLENLPLITFSTVPEHNLSVLIKRLIDFSVAALALAVLSPLMALTALAIKFTSPGPILYTQIRCGLLGRRFGLTKFRTMVDGAEDRLQEIKHLNEMDGPVFKMRNDPRVTPLGRILRRTSIDELPQLWNVLKGEMSIVGPRAPLVEEVRYYSIKQRRRLGVKPGITCLWQVSGRNDLSFQKWMDMDLEYIDKWSVWLDLQIMLKTIPAVLTGKGAR